MHRINYTGRPVLITPDEVLFHAATDEGVDARQILQNIIVAEERWIAPALGDELYYDIANKKNRKVTADNQAALLAEINASRIAEEKEPIAASNIPVGSWVNAIEFVDNEAYVSLWDMFLWKLTAEAVDLATIIPSWLRHTSQGQQKNNPEVIGGNGSGSASGDRRDVQFKIDKFVQDRIDPLLERMHLWMCKRKADYPLYTKACESDNPDGVSYKRKTDWVFNDEEDCGCEGGLNFKRIDDRNYEDVYE